MDFENIAKKVNAYIRPHMDLIEKDYKKRAAELDQLLSTNHNLIGTIVKVHLITEYYLSKYLETTFPNCPFDAARLSFSQKILLIPVSDSTVNWLLPSIKQLNKNRNIYAHNIFTKITFDDLNELSQVVKLSRDVSHGDVERLLLDYAVVCGAFLGRSEEKIANIFQEAFKLAMQEEKKD